MYDLTNDSVSELSIAIRNSELRVKDVKDLIDNYNPHHLHRKFAYLRGNTLLHDFINSDAASGPRGAKIVSHIIKQWQTHCKRDKEREILNVANNLGNTPLHEAIIRRKYPIARELINKGAALDAQNAELNTPLHLAIAAPNGEEIAIHMIEHWRSHCELGDKSDILNILNQARNTALHEAINAGKYELASRMIEWGASINAQNSDLNTPLHLVMQKLSAAIAGTTEETTLWQLADKLIVSGANQNVSNNANRSPRDLLLNHAHRQHFDEFVLPLANLKRVSNLLEDAVGKLQEKGFRLKSKVAKGDHAFVDMADILIKKGFVLENDPTDIGNRANKVDLVEEMTGFIAENFFTKKSKKGRPEAGNVRHALGFDTCLEIHSLMEPVKDLLENGNVTDAYTRVINTAKAQQQLG